MKQRPMSLPEKIRHIRRELHYWMSLRQQNPIMGRDALQEAAERESMRLAGMELLRQCHRAQMRALALRARYYLRSVAECGGFDHNFKLAADYIAMAKCYRDMSSD